MASSLNGCANSSVPRRRLIAHDGHAAWRLRRWRIFLAATASSAASSCGHTNLLACGGFIQSNADGDASRRHSRGNGLLHDGRFGAEHFFEQVRKSDPRGDDNHDQGDRHGNGLFTPGNLYEYQKKGLTDLHFTNA